MRKTLVVLRLTSACLLIAALGLVAGATGAAPKVTATVTSPSPTSRLVHIVNHDRVTYRNFVVVAPVKPEITKASKPCVVARDGGYIGTKFVWQYRAECRKPLAPGQAFNIRLTTSGPGGNLFVYVVVNGIRMRIK